LEAKASTQSHGLLEYAYLIEEGEDLGEGGRKEPLHGGG